MLNYLTKKIFTIFAILILLIQSFGSTVTFASLAYAQDSSSSATLETTTPSPTPSTDPDPSVTPSLDVSPSPSVTPSLDLTSTPEPTIEPTPVSTPSPTESGQVELTPSPSPSPSPTVEPSPTAFPTSSDTQTSQPTVTPIPSPDVSSTPVPTVTPNPTQVDNGQVSVSLLHNNSPPSKTLDLSYNEGSSASLSTNKADYAPTDTAIISGSNFKPNHTYTIYITSIDNYEFTTQITTDDSGSFIYAYQLDGTYRPDYTVEVKEGNHTVATTSFTDSVSEYSQCSNDTGTGYTSGNTGCRWINGNLQSNNSAYYEGDSTPQRLYLNNLSNGSHTILIKYGTTKNGKHAYDFLTDDTFSENWISDADFCEGLSGFSSCSTITPNISSVVPTDPNANGFDLAQVNRHFKIRNGIITSVGTPTLASGSYISTSETTVLITFTVNTGICLDKTSNKCPVLITWGAHVSRQADWGTGNSAVNISGSPYHISLDQEDGASAGQRDNQMQASAIKGSISLDKITNPEGSATSFGFTTAGFSTNVTPSLTDASSPVIWSNLDGGTYTISENSVNGWTLTSKNCTGGGSSIVTQTANGVSITLSQGENLVCTFTNTQQNGTLTVNKVLNPTNDTGKFNLNIDSSIAGSGANVGNGGTTGAVSVNSGSHTVSETAGTNTSLSDYTALFSGDCDANGSVSVSSGQNKVCTITNTKKQAHLIVIKHVINDNGGVASASVFTMTINGVSVIGGNSFAGAENPGTDKTVTGGQYNVTEVGPSGYSASYSLDCIGSITLGETKTCTVTNDDIQPKLTVTKIVSGGTALVVDFPLFVNQTPVLSGVQNSFNGGIYTVSETNQTGYTGVITGDCASNGSVTLHVGEIKACTITNTRDSGTIKVIKDVVPNDNSQWDFTISGPTTSSATLSDGGQSNSFTSDTGSYTVSESAHSGTNGGNYDSLYSCVNGESVIVSGNGISAVFNLNKGYNIVCTFTNSIKKGSISGIKQEVNGDSSLVGTLSGWVITLFSGVTQVAQTTTDVLGNFSFNNLLPGSYSLVETSQNGWTQIVQPGSIVLGPGQTSTGNNFGNFNLGQISGKKYNDLNGSGKDDAGEGGLQGWTIYIDTNNNGQLDQDEVSTTTDTNGHYAFSNLGPGTYRIREVLQNGWAQTDPTNQDSSIGGQSDGSYLVTMTSNGNKTQRNFGNQGRGSITIVKNIVPHNDTVWNFSISGPNSYSQSPTLGDGGSQTYANIATGSYTISETTSSDYTTTVDCNNDSAGTNSVEFDLNVGDNITCTFTNTMKRGSIIVTKFTNPREASSSFSFNLSGSASSSASIKDGESYLFDNLLPGIYNLSEEILAGWSLTNAICDQQLFTNGGHLNLLAGGQINCTFTNTQANPVLKISKTNNKEGIDLSSGDSIIYSIIVSLDPNGGPISGVSVTDLLPSGFIYQEGSWSASSSVHGALSLSEPTYHSPGVWAIGNMVPGEVVTLTYNAKINSDVAPGAYPDVAWAQGTSNSTTLLALAQDPGFVDTNFVGTNVNVVKNNQSGTSIDVVRNEQGQVLGASISLPSTGAETLWLVLAGLMLITGVGSLATGLKLRRKNV